MSKRGEILVENIIFLILNLVFLTILILFLIKQGQGAVLWEEASAKQIALLIDGALPNTVFTLNMEKQLKVAKSNGVPFKDVVSIEGNSVNVKLSSKGGYSYSFFNDVEVESYLGDPEDVFYIIAIGEKDEV